MNNRPVNRQPDDRELRKAFQRLAAQQPDSVQAQHALDLARQTLEREKQSPQTSAPASRDAGRGSHFWFWRIAMPVGLLTTTALVVAFLFTSATPQMASAAEILQRAAQARAEFERWYTLEMRDPLTDQWQVAARLNTAEGRWLIMSPGMGDPSSKAAPQPRWTYTDTQEVISVKFDPRDQTVTVMEHVGGDEALNNLPLTEAALLAFAEEEDRYTSTTYAAEDGGLRIELTKEPLPAGTVGMAAQSHQAMPAKVLAAFHAGSGLLNTVAVQHSEGGELVLVARVRYGTEPIERWEDLVPADARIQDLRPSQEAESLIDQIDGVWQDGLGFRTALVVRRSGHPI